MKCNIGNFDRILRMTIGLILLGLTVTGTIGPWGWVGVIPLVTSLFRFCPVYAILGYQSCAKDSACCK